MAESTPVALTRTSTGLAPILAGVVASGGLAAFAAGQEWLSLDAGQALISASGVAEVVAGSAVASSLIWVVLASWGAVLVTRGWGRRTSAVVGLLSSMGAALATIRWLIVAPDTARWALSEVGGADSEVGLTVWPWLTLLGCAGTFGLAIVALRAMVRWPEMGKRYDAPQSPQGAPVDTDLTSPTDVWKAIDEGRDPTTRPDA